MIKTCGGGRYQLKKVLRKLRDRESEEGRAKESRSRVGRGEQEHWSEGPDAREKEKGRGDREVLEKGGRAGPRVLEGRHPGLASENEVVEDGKRTGGREELNLSSPTSSILGWTARRLSFLSESKSRPFEKSRRLNG